MGYSVKEPSVSVVVPAKNEARNLRVVLPELPSDYEIVLVDGHSVDGTIDAACEVRPDVKVVNQTRRGKGNALNCGFHAATGDIIVMFDADGSADPAEIPAFIAALKDGADFAKGTRFAEGGGSDDITALRRLGNFGLNGITNGMFGTSYTDLCYGYNAFWSRLVPHFQLPDLDLDVPEGTMVWGDGFEIETILNIRVALAGCDVAEVPSVELSRKFGESNLRTFVDGRRVLRTIVSEWQQSGSRGLARGRRRPVLAPTQMVVPELTPMSEEKKTA